MILVSNIFLIVGASITVVPDGHLVCLFIGRFIFGLSTGALAVICPKYMAETAPIKIKGPIGGCSALLIVSG